jgi:hypothetical protein
MTVQRLKTAREGWFWIFKLVYGFLAFPFLLFFSIAMTSITLSAESEQRVAAYEVLAIASWVGVLFPIALLIKGVFARRWLLKKITSAVRDPLHFDPDSAHEMYHEGDGKYLGIDINNGTILYIHRIRQGQVDVLGLSMGDWTNREVEGSMFRLYTKIPQLPRIEISTPWAQRWFDTLGAMEHKRYDTPQPFKAYVNDHIHLLEHENKIQIPKLA